WYRLSQLVSQLDGLILGAITYLTLTQLIYPLVLQVILLSPQKVVRFGCMNQVSMIADNQFLIKLRPLVMLLRQKIVEQVVQEYKLITLEDRLIMSALSRQQPLK
ncbi:MAG: hypothetical protein EZS28_011665, partial [Streblomastix strix]